MNGLRVRRSYLWNESIVQNRDKKDNVVKTIFRARQRKQQITMGELYPFDQAKAPVKDKVKEWATRLQNECTHENGGEIPRRSMIVSETGRQNMAEHDSLYCVPM